MSGGSVWLAPVGTVIGAVLAYFGARAGVRADRDATGQRELAGRREEWGRRFGTGLEYLGSERAQMRLVGHQMLVQLLESRLATQDDRALGEAVLSAVLYRVEGESAVPADTNLVVDARSPGSHDGDEKAEEPGT